MLILTEILKPRLALYVDAARSRAWKGIVWHHSVSPDGKLQDWPALQEYHTSYRVDFKIVAKAEFDARLRNQEGGVFQQPWRTVGYHFGTSLPEGKPTLHRGRPLSLMGIHTRVRGRTNEFNQDYMGLCAVGDFNREEPSSDFWEFNLRLTRTFLDVFRIPPENVISHVEAQARLEVPSEKICPGRRWDMDLFRRDL